MFNSFYLIPLATNLWAGLACSTAVCTLHAFRCSKENILPSPSEKQIYDDIIKQAEEEIIRAGKYHIGKNS